MFNPTTLPHWANVVMWVSLGVSYFCGGAQALWYFLDNIDD